MILGGGIVLGFYKDGLLERLALAEDEARASALNDRSYAEFKASYDEYVRRFRPCENSHSEDS